MKQFKKPKFWPIFTKFYDNSIRVNFKVLKISSPLGPRQTSNFCKQYCDKAILQQSNIFLTKYCYCFSKSAEITMNGEIKFTWRKNIAGKMSFYHNIVISFYHNIAHQNCSSDKGLRENFWPKKYRSFNLSPFLFYF